MGQGNHPEPITPGSEPHHMNMENMDNTENTKKSKKIEKTSVSLDGKSILVTGAAGFIGSNLCARLLRDTQGATIVGIDCMTDYNPLELKEYRLRKVEEAAQSSKSHWVFIRGDIADKPLIDELFATYRFHVLVNLAAQAGVRYSIDHPDVYIHSNLIGFYNLLEAARHDDAMEHFVYASSSSVYGGNKKVPFSTDDPVDHPVSLYAATKKSNELMAHAYSKLYNIPSTGLRFFTVYGPAGRTDMFYFSATNRLVKGDSIQIFNYGNCKRDFTYIDDIVEGIRCVIEAHYADKVPARVYNIGCSHPVKLIHFIHTIEEATGRQAQMIMMDMQPGDVTRTDADTTSLEHDFGFHPTTDIHEGVARLYAWYKKVWPTIQ